MITEALIEEMGRMIASPEGLAGVREAWPALRITECSDDDIGAAKPVFEGEGFYLYLFGGGHCLTLTNDYDGAIGVVVAAVEEDEAP